jgi:hypothetical protein
LSLPERSDFRALGGGKTGRQSSNAIRPLSFDDYFDRFNATAVHFWENGLPRQLAHWEVSGRPGLRFFFWVDKDGRSRDGGEMLGAIGPNRPGRVGFQVGDEPGLKGKGFAGVLPFREGVEAVGSADPNALVAMNFGSRSLCSAAACGRRALAAIKRLQSRRGAHLAGVSSALATFGALRLAPSEFARELRLVWQDEPLGFGPLLHFLMVPGTVGHTLRRGQIV